MPRKKKNHNGLGLRVGQNIKTARNRNGITQAQLAEIIGVEVETISRIETGAQLPSLDRLQEIATALNEPLPALLSDGQGDNHALKAILEELPERERQFVYAFAISYVQHWRCQAKEK